MENKTTSHFSESNDTIDASSSTMQKLESLEQQLAQCTKDLSDSKERFLRLNADFENSRKRAFRDQLHSETRLKESMLKGLLLVVDTVERALEHARNDEAAQNLSEWIKGTELIQKELLAYLSQQGVTRMPEAVQFDPMLHEAISTVSAENKNSGDIVTITRTGYLLNAAILRPMQVIVAQ